MLVTITIFDSSFCLRKGQWGWGTLVLKCPTSMMISTIMISVTQD